MGRGRPAKLTPEVQQRIVTAIAAGNYREPSCTYAGVSIPTFHAWMNKGRQQRRGKYRDFLNAVEGAEAQNEVALVANWRSKTPEDWKAARDMLDRRHSARWAQKVRIQVEEELNDFLARLKDRLAPEVFEQVLAAVASDSGREGIGADTGEAEEEDEDDRDGPGAGPAAAVPEVDTEGEP